MDELVEEAGLPHARLADHGDHLTVPSARPLERDLKQPISASRPTNRVNPRAADRSRRVRTAPALVTS